MGLRWRLHPAQAKISWRYVTKNQKQSVSFGRGYDDDSKAGMTLQLRLPPITDRSESRIAARSASMAARLLAQPTSHYFANPLVAAYGQGARNLLRFVYFRDAAYVTRQGMRGRDHDIQGSVVPRQVAKKRGKGFCGYPVATVASTGQTTRERRRSLLASSRTKMLTRTC